MRGAVAGDQVGRGRRFQMQRECCVWGREWVQRSDPQVRKGHSGGADSWEALWSTDFGLGL